MDILLLEDPLFKKSLLVLRLRFTVDMEIL